MTRNGKRKYFLGDMQLGSSFLKGKLFGLCGLRGLLRSLRGSTTFGVLGLSLLLRLLATAGHDTKYGD